MPVLLSQIIYMVWISRSRTLPLFMEATHAVTAFTISATLLSAVVKPFGRPFKITDKGGDRSAPRVHWKLASVFGLLSLSSALSIVWAFVSPYAATEISSIDFFNLLWAGIAMVIAFIAFLVCFELPRGEALFAVDEAAQLALDDNVISGHVTGLSTSSAQIFCARNLPARLSNPTVKLYLDARLVGSKRKFQVVPKPSLDCDCDRHLRSVSNSWSRCSVRRPVMLLIPQV